MAYRVVDDINFSLIHSGLVYYSNDSVLPTTDISKTGWVNGSSMIFKDKQNNEKYFAKRIRYYDDEEDYENYKDEYIRKHYINLIANPPIKGRVLWPTDIIELTSFPLEKTDLLVANSYRVYANDVNVDKSPFALLFSCGSHSLYSQIKEPLSVYIESLRQRYEEGIINYNTPEIRKIIYSLADNMSKLNMSGYFYNDIDISRFFVDYNDRVIFDFSNLIYTQYEFKRIMNDKLYIEEPLEVPMVYEDPTVFSQKRKIPDFFSQNYSLCALFFHLMFDVEPYNGSLYDYMDSSTKMSNYNKCQQYLSDPAFIFDTEDTRNNLGVGKEYQIYKDLWEKCPNEIKDIFMKTLVKDNATRENKHTSPYVPEPHKWLRLFEDLHWV